ncbi:D-2-hydroxyacid dehydrogenase [Desulfovibrio inopinatus]|uniref:D-2-hydroxyacid dehydrogenase n=1 Tax=Desulfovibrio inopinatus TaxID=102109 RepID=UPI0004139AF7|nr:D-2-hydroxyacid dehydrogenase [Desulfovibrio inopinatus]
MNAHPHIVVLDGYTLNPGDNSWDDVAALGQFTVFDRTADQDILDRAGEADIILTNKTPLTRQTIEALPRLRMIAVLATGYDVVDIVAAKERGIVVCNVPVYSTDSVAQFVMACILDHVRRIDVHDAACKSGDWTKNADFSFWLTNQIELTGKTLGIVGFGRIGAKTAELGHGLGMNILAYAPRPKPAPAYTGFAFAETIDALFETADIISLHCPLTADNKGFVDARLLDRMKKEALFINTARGALVNEEDLAAALSAGTISGAYLDVLGVEPPPASHPLLHAPRCRVTPHVAWATLAARQRLMATTAQNIKAFLAGTPQNQIV